ncbi:unnamed protein product [Caenorhabditis sp. 36 PRJEB53466]|nr:unnamed protein product [Caenorhabditis sp. 36 PRJEB53466]
MRMVSEQNKVKVAIIGAGFAGLRAARHFEQVGIEYTIIEGSDRVGGRVYPFSYNKGYLHYGAEYVNGLDNEIYQIVEKHNLLDKTESRTNDLWMLDEGTLTIIDGKRVEDGKLNVWKEFVKNINDKLYEESSFGNGLQKSVSDKIDEHFSIFLEEYKFGEEDRATYENLCRIFKNYFQTEWSSPVHELGLRNLCTWEDGTTVEDSAVLNEFGFQKILEEFTCIIPKEKIRLNSKVININYGDLGSAKILLENGETVYFDAVIVTCSLGFLKHHKRTLFTPSLPRQKEDAIDRIGFGSNMKVFLEYNTPWWPDKTSTIMISSQTDGEHSKLTDNLMVFQPSSWARNILVSWIAGCGPYEVSLKTDEQLKTVIDSFLKENLKGEYKVENICRIFRHNWMDDMFSLGSYSYLLPGTHQNTIKVLAEPLMNGSRPLVCFAGEHTDPQMYQTTVGAARSGHREAMRISVHLLSSDN